jgi:hypothetical protein
VDDHMLVIDGNMGHESFIDAAILGPLVMVREIVLLAGRQVVANCEGNLNVRREWATTHSCCWECGRRVGLIL